MSERYQSGHLCKTLGISTTSLYKWEKKGIIPKAQRDKISKRRFWTKDQVDEAKKRTGRV